MKKVNINSYRTFYVFDSKGLALDDFKVKEKKIASCLDGFVESLKQGKSPKWVTLTVSKRPFPKKVCYKDISKKKNLAEGSFFLGHSGEGVVFAKISELPHVLIAGATGTGKSVFFKQALLGLLESTLHLQMYLIDLKGGLEMIDFVQAPNVQVIKDTSHALYTLERVQKEMKARFSYLEGKGLKQIIPLRDKKERILVAIDEASVLYMTRPKFDPHHEATIKARGLADSISKLSRAGAIHLMLATQKLEKSVIPSSVSENISGRMIFRTNSLQGSLMMLGTKEAMNLPEVKGRGIWQFGSQKKTLQVPYIDPKDIQKRCQVIAKEFQTGKRKLFNPMINMRPNKGIDQVTGEILN